MKGAWGRGPRMAAAAPDERAPAPLEIASPDGTRIAAWRSGAGRPLVLVHGTTADHNRWRPVLKAFESKATVYTFDRRGRGESGDGATYAIEREFEDVAAVVDKAASDSGGPVDLLGHSHGAICSIGGVSRTPNERRLLL